MGCACFFTYKFYIYLKLRGLRMYKNPQDNSTKSNKGVIKILFRMKNWVDRLQLKMEFFRQWKWREREASIMITVARVRVMTIRRVIKFLRRVLVTGVISHPCTRVLNFHGNLNCLDNEISSFFFFASWWSLRWSMKIKINE